MRSALSGLIDRFQAKFPPNRLTALAMGILIPFVITPAAAYIAVYVPAHFPGLPTFTVVQLTAFGVAGGSAALLAGLTAGYKWLDGWQFDESRQRAAIALAATREHEKHMEAMRLESKERVAIAEQADSAAEAADALGLGEAMGAIQPPPAAPPVPSSPDPVLSPSVAVPEPTEGPVDPEPPVIPPLPLPPQAAAEGAGGAKVMPPGR